MINARPFLVASALLTAMTGLGACTQPYGPRPDFDYRYADVGTPVYAGGDYGVYGVGGDGAGYLDPWLSGTRPGQRLILAHFDHNMNGRIGIDRAGEANRWFRRYADRDGDLTITDREISRALIAVDAALRRERY